jgi:DNA-binding CsgD family transcriptional regulator/photosystem II stability/assembly factor-like uncharacterized protein
MAFSHAHHRVVLAGSGSAQNAVVTTDSRQRIPRRQSLTPRQEEILALIDRGCTNFEIAERLGITLDGAKWHVSEIITKFGVQTREEAVEAWRAEQSLGQRFARAARALLAPILVHKVVLAGVAGAVVLVAGGAIAVAAYRSGGNSAGDASSVRDASPLRDLPRSPTYGHVIDHPVFTWYQMFDSKVGWAQATDGNRIILTEDGGRTWKDVSPDLAGSENLLARSMAFIDADHTVVIAAPPRIEKAGDIQAHVFWTADRGRTWHESDSPITLGAEQAGVTFVDPEHVWIRTGTLASPLLLYRTTDGGRSWQTVPVQLGTIDGDPLGSLPKACSLLLHWVSTSRGFAYGGATVAAATALPCFFRSDDGGATWQRVLLPDVVAGQYTGATLSFPTPTDGFVSFSPTGNLALYATHDGGLTWGLAGRVPGTSPGGTYNSVALVDALHGWVIGQPTWQRTIDGAQTWESFTPNTPMPSAEFVSPDEGFGWPAFGQTLSSDATVPPLYHTLDGGKTWQPVGP